jgi:hypothetical protein
MLEGSTLGTLVELMVRAEILAGSDGRLIPSPFEPDVDHRDVERLQLATVLEPLVGAAGPATVEELTSLRDRA